MWSILWSPLAVELCLLIELAVLASTMGEANICAASGLFPGDVVENSVEYFCKGSDFLPAMPCASCAGYSHKSKLKLFGFERLAFVWSPPLNPSLEHPLPKRSPDRVRDTVGGCAFTPASWLLPCWLRPSHCEIFSLMLIPCSCEGGLPDCAPCQDTVVPFCRRSISPPPRLPCSSPRASMLRGGQVSVLHKWFHQGFPHENGQKNPRNVVLINPEMISKNSTTEFMAVTVFIRLHVLAQSHFSLCLLCKQPKKKTKYKNCSSIILHFQTRSDNTMQGQRDPETNPGGYFTNSTYLKLSTRCRHGQREGQEEGYSSFWLLCALCFSVAIIHNRTSQTQWHSKALNQI